MLPFLSVGVGIPMLKKPLSMLRLRFFPSVFCLVRCTEAPAPTSASENPSNRRLANRDPSEFEGRTNIEVNRLKQRLRSAPFSQLLLLD